MQAWGCHAIYGAKYAQIIAFVVLHAAQYQISSIEVYITESDLQHACTSLCVGGARRGPVHMLVTNRLQYRVAGTCEAYAVLKVQPSH